MKWVTGRSSNLNINKRQPPYDNHPLSVRLKPSWSQFLAPEGYKQALGIIIIIHNRTCSIIQEHCSRLIYFPCLPPPPKGLNPQSEWVAIISCGALSYLPYRRQSHHHNNTHTRPGQRNSFLDRSAWLWWWLSKHSTSQSWSALPYRKDREWELFFLCIDSEFTRVPVVSRLSFLPRESCNSRDTLGHIGSGRVCMSTFMTKARWVVGKPAAANSVVEVVATN